MKVCAYTAILLAAASAACSSSTKNTEVALDQEIQAQIGSQVSVSSSALRVLLISVTEDSRCPTQVVCVWAGNARVQFAAIEGSGMPVPFELNTTLTPQSADVLGYRITLLALTPAKTQPEDQIPNSQYRARLRIERAAK
jgi:hypothetical protein